MKYKIIFTSLFLFASTSTPADDSKKKWCDLASEDRRLYLKYPDSAPYSPPTSNVMSPFASNTPFNKITPVEIANALSGYYCDSLNNHPLIYASSGGFTITGNGFSKSYPISKMNEAFAAYTELLISTGYLKGK